MCGDMREGVCCRDNPASRSAALTGLSDEAAPSGEVSKTERTTSVSSGLCGSRMRPCMSSRGPGRLASLRLRVSASRLFFNCICLLCSPGSIFTWTSVEGEQSREETKREEMSGQKEEREKTKFACI